METCCYYCKHRDSKVTEAPCLYCNAYDGNFEADLDKFKNEIYKTTRRKLEAVAEANDTHIRDVIYELVEYGLDRMIDDYGWDKPKGE